MQRVLVNVKVKLYKITKRQLLSDTTKKKRYERSKMFLNKLLDGMHPQVLYTDEKLFAVQAIHNSQNDQIQCLLNVELHSGGKNQLQIMVWAGVTSTGLKTLLVFMELVILVFMELELVFSNLLTCLSEDVKG